LRPNGIIDFLKDTRGLKYLGEEKQAKRLEAAVSTVIAEGKHVTYDLKSDRNERGSVGTSQMADAIIDKLK
jgi:isocitrate dehydrogenase (NAD+)